MEPRFVSTTTAGHRLGVSPDTVRRWIEAGQLEARRTLGGHLRIPVTELDRMEQVLVRLQDER